MLVLFSWSTISHMCNSFHWVIKSQIIDCNSFNFNVDSIFLENEIQMCVSFNWEIKSQIIDCTLLNSDYRFYFIQFNVCSELLDFLRFNFKCFKLVNRMDCGR